MSRCTNRTARAFQMLGIILSVLIAHPAWAQDQKPNIIFIMGDDIGWSNIGVYNQGGQSALEPLRADGNVQRQGYWVDSLLQLVCLRVLALRVRAAGGGA